MTRKSSNWLRAPKSAAFVKQMRAVFGDVKVIYVKEGDLKLGEPDTDRPLPEMQRSSA